jgi:hypothetical protein
MESLFFLDTVVFFGETIDVMIWEFYASKAFSFAFNISHSCLAWRISYTSWTRR